MASTAPTALAGPSPGGSGRGSAVGPAVHEGAAAGRRRSSSSGGGGSGSSLTIPSPPDSPTTPTALGLDAAGVGREPQHEPAAAGPMGPAASAAGAGATGPSAPSTTAAAASSFLPLAGNRRWAALGAARAGRLGKSSSCGELSHMVGALLSPGVLLGGPQPQQQQRLLLRPLVPSPRKPQQPPRSPHSVAPPNFHAGVSSSSSSSSASSSSSSSLDENGGNGGNGGRRRSGMKRDLHKASLANELCHAAAELLLLQNPTPSPTPEAAVAAVQAHLAKFPARYCLSVEASDVVAHMSLLAEAARTGQAAVLVTPAATEEGSGAGEGRWVVTVSSRDRPHLLDALTRTLSSHATQIVDADAMTGADGMALDRFVVESREGLAGRQAAIARSVEEQLGRAAAKDGEGAAAEAASPLADPGALASSGSSSSSSACSEASDGPVEGLAKTQQPPRRLLRRRPGGGGMIAGVVGGTQEEEEEEEEEDGDDISMQQTPPYPAFYGEGGGNAMIPFEEIELVDVVTRGPAGALWKGMWKGQAVAVKMITTTSSTTVGVGGGGVPVSPHQEEAATAAAARLREDFERERRIVRGLRHPNLCRLLGTSACPGSLCLIYEYVNGGTLTALLRDRSQGYDLFQIALDVAAGMDYLHKRGVMHRDLKPDNLLLHTGGPGGRGPGRTVIADFGLVCPTLSESEHTGETGTYRYMSSEVIRHEPYSTAADVYSYGVVLNELLTREQPFRGMTPIQAAFAVARQGLRPAIPPGTPTKLAQLIQACWHEDPIRRPTFSQILRALKQIQHELQPPPPPTAVAAAAAPSSSDVMSISPTSSLSSLSAATGGSSTAGGSSSGGSSTRSSIEGGGSGSHGSSSRGSN